MRYTPDLPWNDPRRRIARALSKAVAKNMGRQTDMYTDEVAAATRLQPGVCAGYFEAKPLAEIQNLTAIYTGYRIRLLRIDGGVTARGV